MKHFKKAHRHMIAGQFLPNKLTDPDVIHAFEMVWREDFMPEDVRPYCYSDATLPLGNGRYALSPLSLMRLLQAASITKKETVLHVAAGVGYGSVLMAYLARKVVALEEDPALFERLGHLPDGYDAPNMKPVLGPLEQGYGVQGPYDVIVIEGAVGCQLEALQEQLKDGGRLYGYRPVPGSAIEGAATAFVTRRFGFQFVTTPLFEGYAPLLQAFACPKSFKLV